MFQKGRNNIKNIRRLNRILFCTKNSKNGNQIEIPPEPTNCCMSGCPNCVWVEYAETLSKLFKDGGSKARDLIMEKVSDPNMRAYLSMELRNLERLKNNNSDSSTSKNSESTNHKE